MTASPANRRGTRWLASIGVLLLGIAAVSLVSARWEQFEPGSRLAILLIASGIVFGVTQVVRPLIAETARALDVLVATLVPVDVAALTIVSGSTWRGALVAAGPAAVIASETLRRRDPTIVTELGTAVGGVLATCGVAALHPASAPILLAGLGLVAVLVTIGHDRSFPVIWAALAGLAPAVRVLDDAVFTGMGTMRDLGLLDGVAAWETLTAGLLATVALCVAASARRSPVIGLTAVASAAATGIQLWATIDPPGTVGFIAVAVALGVIELALAHPLARNLGDVGLKMAGDLNAVATGMLTMVTAAAAWVALRGESVPADHLRYAAAVLAAVWVLADLRRALGTDQSLRERVRVGSGWAPALPGFVAAVASAVYLGTGRSLLLGLVLAGLGLFAIGTVRRNRLAVAIGAFSVSPFLVTEIAWVAMAVSAVATVGLVHAAATVARRDERLMAAFVAALGLVTAASGTVAGLDVGLTEAGVFMIVVLWIAGRSLDSTLPDLGRAFRVIGQLGLLMVGADDYLIAAMVAGVAAVVAAIEHRDRGDDHHRLHAATNATFAWWFALGAAGVDLTEAYVLPPLWIVVAATARDVGRQWVTIGPALAVTAVIAIGGRIEDGRAAHMVALGGVALGVAIWGAVRDDRTALAVGGATAVATALYEGLARSVGVETWGWLVIGGTAAITAAGLLERHDASTPDTTSVS